MHRAMDQLLPKGIPLAVPPGSPHSPSLLPHSLAGWLWTASAGGTACFLIHQSSSGDVALSHPQSPVLPVPAHLVSPLRLVRKGGSAQGGLWNLQLFGLCSHCTCFSGCSGDAWGCISIRACGVQHQHLPWPPRQDGTTIRVLPIWSVQPRWFQLGWYFSSSQCHNAVDSCMSGMSAFTLLAAEAMVCQTVHHCSTIAALM